MCNIYIMERTPANIIAHLINSAQHLYGHLIFYIFVMKLKSNIKSFKSSGETYFWHQGTEEARYSYLGDAVRCRQHLSSSYLRRCIPARN